MTRRKVPGPGRMTIEGTSHDIRSLPFARNRSAIRGHPALLPAVPILFLSIILLFAARRLPHLGQPRPRCRGRRLEPRAKLHQALLVDLRLGCRSGAAKTLRRHRPEMRNLHFFPSCRINPTSKHDPLTRRRPLRPRQGTARSVSPRHSGGKDYRSPRLRARCLIGCLVWPQPSSVPAALHALGR